VVALALGSICRYGGADIDLVTQIGASSIAQATRDYLVGTLGGAVYGAAVAVLIPHSGEGRAAAVLVLAVAPLDSSLPSIPSLNVATVTADYRAAPSHDDHGDPLDSAIDRGFEVAVGAITGLLVSFLVLPSAPTARSAQGADVLEFDGVSPYELFRA